MTSMRELLVREDPETARDLIRVLEVAMEHDLEKLRNNRDILTNAHLHSLDTRSFTETMTSTLGVFRGFGQRRSLKVATALRSLIETETKIIEEITNRPYKLMLAFATLLRKIAEEMNTVDEIKITRQIRRDNNVSRRFNAMLAQIEITINTLDRIDPERAKRARSNLNDAQDAFGSEVESVNGDSRFTDEEKRAMYEAALNRFSAASRKM